MRTLTGAIIVLGFALSASNGLAQDEVLLNEWAELPPGAFEESVRIELCEGGVVKGEIDSLVLASRSAALGQRETVRTRRHCPLAI